MSFTKDADELIPSNIVNIDYTTRSSVSTTDVVNEFYSFRLLTKRSNAQLLEFIKNSDLEKQILNDEHKWKIKKSHTVVSFITESLIIPNSYDDPKHMKEWLESHNHYLNKILKEDLNNEFDAIMFANDITRTLSDLKSENENFFSKTRMQPYLNEDIVTSYRF